MTDEQLEIIQRLDNWATIYGSSKNPQFIDDLRAVLDMAQNSGLQPIATAPKDGRHILLFGPSGYVTTPLRCHVCRWGRYQTSHPWVTHSGEYFTDSGDPPTHWMPLPCESP